MLVYIEAEGGTSSHVRAETLIQAVGYYEKIHPGTFVTKAARIANLKLVLEGCYDTAEEQLEALLTAIKGVGGDGYIERQLQEYVYRGRVGTECAEFAETKEEE